VYVTFSVDPSLPLLEVPIGPSGKLRFRHAAFPPPRDVRRTDPYQFFYLTRDRNYPYLTNTVVIPFATLTLLSLRLGSLTDILARLQEPS